MLVLISINGIYTHWLLHCKSKCSTPKVITGRYVITLRSAFGQVEYSPSLLSDSLHLLDKQHSKHNQPLIVYWRLLDRMFPDSFVKKRVLQHSREIPSVWYNDYQCVLLHQNEQLHKDTSTQSQSTKITWPQSGYFSVKKNWVILIHQM